MLKSICFTRQLFVFTFIFNNFLLRSIGSNLSVSVDLPYSELNRLKEQTSILSYDASKKKLESKIIDSRQISIDDEYNEEYLIIYHDLNRTRDTKKCLFNTKTLKCVYDIDENIDPSYRDETTTRHKRRLSLTRLINFRKRYLFDNSPYNNHDQVPQPKLAPQHLIDEIEYYVKYAGGSYCEMNSVNNSKCIYCLDFDEKYVILPIENKTTGMHAIMVALPSRREIVIAYRGSDKTYKLIYSMSRETTEFPGVENSKVHKYFYESTVSIQKDITVGLKYFLSLYPDFKIVLTGHSLGGGLATLAAPLIHRDLFMPYSRFRVITYGQLRIGNAEFANWYNKLDINFTRVVNGYDEATDTPGFSVDWVHVKKEVHIVDNQYYVCEATLLKHPHCSFRRTWLIGLFTDHESVRKIGLSPRYCKNSFYFFKVKFGF